MSQYDQWPRYGLTADVIPPPLRELIDDLTVVIPTYDRNRYFLHYLQEGFWDGVRVLLVCDGSPDEAVEELRSETAGRDIEVHAYSSNSGVAHAVGTGVRSVSTGHFMFCGDDDFNVDYMAFLAEAAEILRLEEEVLFVTMPQIHAFDEQLHVEPQYDRSSFDGCTGTDLLERLVRTGEMRALVAGSLFKTSDVAPVLPEPLFRASEDLVMLTRLCARYPDRTVRVATKGRRMRLMHAGSLSARPTYSLEKIVLNLLALSVGGYYLIERGTIDRSELHDLLLSRGHVLQQGYGKGAEAARALVGCFTGGRRLTGEEAKFTTSYLDRHRTALPQEVISLLDHEPTIRSYSNTPSVNIRSQEGRRSARHVFVGGSPRSGTTALQLVLCQDICTNPMLPEAHYLRTFLNAYSLSSASLGDQVPQYFEDADDYRAFNARIVQEYLERTRRRCSDPATLVLKDPQLTPHFPELSELVPDARFLCIVRDPRDVIASLMRVGRKMRAKGTSGHIVHWTEARDLEKLCAYYASCYAPLLSSRDASFLERTLFLRYEDLVAHPEPLIDELRAFTGLRLESPYDEPMDTGTVDYDERGNSPWCSPLYGAGITAARVGAYLEELSEEEAAFIATRCAELTRALGYSESRSESSRPLHSAA